MKMPAINPVFLKELRQLVRARAVVWGMLAFPILLFLVTALVVSSGVRGNSRLEVIYGPGLGMAPFTATAVILGIAIVIMLPLYSAVKTTQETANGRMSLEFITKLSPIRIVTGKMLAALMLMLVAAAIAMPFFSLAYLLRGVPFVLTLVVPLALVAGGILQLSLMTLVATQMRRPTGLRIGSIILLFFATPFIYGIVSSIIRSQMRYHSGPVDITPGVVTVAILFITIVLLSRATSAAHLSPPFVDAVRPLRVTQLSLLALSTVMLFFNPTAWSVCWTVLAVFIALAASYSSLEIPRAARGRVPKTTLLRFLAFLITGGAASGILFSVLLAAVAAIPALCSGEDGTWAIPCLYAEVVPAFVITSAFAVMCGDSRKAHAIAFAIAFAVIMYACMSPALEALDILRNGAPDHQYGNIFTILEALADKDKLSYSDYGPDRLLMMGAGVILAAISAVMMAFRSFRRFKRK